MALAVTLLPQPDPPTKPTRSPGATEKLTLSTACTKPSCDAKSTDKSWTSSNWLVIPPAEL